MNLFELKLLGIIGLVAFVLFGVHSVLQKQYDKGLNDCKAAYAQTALQETLRRQDTSNKITNDAQKATDKRNASNSALDESASRLRNTVDSSISAKSPSPSASSPSTDSRIILLTNMLRSAEERLRQLAKTADARGDAGSSCEAYYHSLE
jgi:hypothetical protein